MYYKPLLLSLLTEQHQDYFYYFLYWIADLIKHYRIKLHRLLIISVNNTTILFDQAHSVLPTCCWFVMYEWYSQLTINIKWRGCHSKDVGVNIGTRQGELSSPLLFNIFYQDLIDRLSSQHCGIRISKESYNVFCNGDDLILTSLTVTGFQSLIDVSRDYITAQGLIRIRIRIRIILLNH